jgi:hypothetical protein
MKVVIRHPVTRLYRGKDGTWIKDWKEAHQFEGSFEGVKFCSREELDAYQVVMKHPENDLHDVVVLERMPGQTRPAGSEPRMHLFKQARPESDSQQP